MRRKWRQRGCLHANLIFFGLKRVSLLNNGRLVVGPTRIPLIALLSATGRIPVGATINANHQLKLAFRPPSVAFMSILQIDPRHLPQYITPRCGSMGAILTINASFIKFMHRLSRSSESPPWSRRRNAPGEMSRRLPQETIAAEGGVACDRGGSKRRFQLVIRIIIRL